MPYLIIPLVIVIIAVIWAVSVSNSFNRDRVKIEEARSGIDVALTKRHDVLTKMLDIAKGYASHEKETLFKVIELRRGMTVSEMSRASDQMNEALKGISVVAESYPELRSSENFRALQISVSDTEEHLQAARRLYNSNVASYNARLVTFPSSVIAGMKHLERMPLFEAEESKRADVKMEF